MGWTNSPTPFHLKSSENLKPEIIKSGDKVNSLNIKTEIWLLTCSISVLKIWLFNLFNFSAFPIYILSSLLHRYQSYNKVIVKWYSSQSSFCKLPKSCVHRSNSWKKLIHASISFVKILCIHQPLFFDRSESALSTYSTHLL